MSKFLKSLTDEQLELLKSEVTSEFERRFMVTDSIKEAQQINAQARRDEIVEQAKQDIKKIESVGRSYLTPGDIGNFTYRQRLFYVEFVVNRKKRTVVALVRGARTGKLRERGIAKCHPNDCFNVHIGKAIAIRRALGLEVPEEYYNAPQPTEVRVGDVVTFPGGINKRVLYRVDDTEKKEDNLTIVRCDVAPSLVGKKANADFTNRDSMLPVVDDSRE